MRSPDRASRSSCLTRCVASERDKADYEAYQIHADNYGLNANGTAVEIRRSLSTSKKHDEEISAAQKHKHPPTVLITQSRRVVN